MKELIEKLKVIRAELDKIIEAAEVEQDIQEIDAAQKLVSDEPIEG